jgi:uncharacterized membrane protein YheB (UPF0754 family)
VNENIPAVLDVTLQVPMDALLAAYTERIPEWSGNPDEYSDGPPPAVRDAIGERVAQIIAAQILDADMRKDIRRAIQDKVLATVAEAVGDAVTGEIRQTNQWGEATGPVTTMRELIIQEAKDYLSKPVDNYNRDKGTKATVLIRAEVDKAIKEDLNEALKVARAEVTALLKSKAADAIAATVAGMGGLRL